jgi:hypothetical protein
MKISSPVGKNGNKYQQLPLSSIILEDLHPV